MGRFRRVINDINGSDLQWVVHVGDILWFPCSEEAFTTRLESMNTVGHPVVYTPGDNEWADCHERIAGGYQPLDRLHQLRATFFAEPTRSLGGRPLSLRSQVADSTFSEFVENARWTYGGFVFATLHVVGSGNGSYPFPERTEANDQEIVRRTAAALSWLEETFAIAETHNQRGVVLVWHASPWRERTYEPWPEYEEILGRLAELVERFAGPVLLIHGDSHIQRVDHPLRSRETGTTLENFTRLETYGSPDIGWVRVIVDSVTGRFVEYEPRLMMRRLFW